MGAALAKTTYSASVPVRDREQRDVQLAEELARVRQDVADITAFAKDLKWWASENKLEGDEESAVLNAIDECRFLVEVSAEIFVELSNQTGDDADFSEFAIPEGR